MPPSRSNARIFPRWMVAAAVIFIVGWLLYLLRGALTPIFFAFLIAYMLDPVVDRFEARGWSRGTGIAVMLTAVLGGMGLLVALALPGLVRDLVAFFTDLPDKGRELFELVEPWLDTLGIAVPHSMSEALAQFQVDMGELAQKAALPVGEILLWLLQRTGRLLGAIASLLMVPVFAAYLLYDFDRITAGIRDLVPGRYRDWVVEVAHDVDGVLGEFIRGQLIVMLILAVLYSMAYLIVGVKLAVLIGVVAGLLSFIPYVGGGVALVLAVVMSLIYWTGWPQLVGVVVVYSIIQVFEGFYVTPRIVGDKVGLPAVWVLFALLVGGELFGFMGVLLALPAAAVIKIFVGRGLTWYRASELFLGVQPPAAGKVEERPAPDESLPEPPPGATDDAVAREVPTETEATETEATETEATETEAAETEATETEATETEATEAEATETEATETESAETGATETEADASATQSDEDDPLRAFDDPDG
ncbi:MAG: AI-2E family transporter [Myxococcota bacterium]